MERRMTKYRQVSPERAKVWTEKSANYVQNRKVPVVYYLCRNRQLDHPHFIEVQLSSSEGLYLRDFIEKLNVLRGRGMASMYSWSCKRSYKNGFVWNDLCEDDLIIPAQGNEYVLKGSEIIVEANSAGQLSPAATFRTQNVKQLPEPPSSRSQGDTSSSSSMNTKDSKHHQEDEISPPSRCSGCSAVSIESRAGNSSSWVGSLSLTECKAAKNDGAADASTQTEESTRSSTKIAETCTRGVCTEDGLTDGKCAMDCHNHDQYMKRDSQICRNSPSPLSSYSASSSGGKPDTLESLIRTDASKINSFRILEEEDVRVPPNRKLKASDVLMQLISCGSISAKDHSFGLVPTYRPQFSNMKYPSPVYSMSSMLGELDCLPENSRLMGRRLEDKEYFSGSLVETKMLKERDSHISLKRSNSFEANRSSSQHELHPHEGSTSARSRCLPLSIKASGSSKQPRHESMRSPLSDKPRSLFSSNLDDSFAISRDAPNGDSQRFREDRDKIMKIEERLASGARIIIQSKEN